MARNDCHVVLIAALLASARLAAGAPDWASDLRRDLNEMTRNIHEQTRQFQQDLNERLAEVNEQIKNLPEDSQGLIISNGNTISSSNGRITINGRTFVNDGNSMNLSVVNGVIRVVTSGRTPDGEPYVRTVEERSDEKYLYHNETSYNPKTNQITEKIRWRLDRTTPGATPENLADEK